MSDMTVRALGEEEWEQYRSVRLAALEDSPDAFVASADEEGAFEEDFWRMRLRRSSACSPSRRAPRSGSPASARPARSEEDNAGRRAVRAVGRPAARGTGVATQLVQAGADAARQQGRSHLAYWVGTDNGRAVAFASGFGFRPTDFRRPMRVKGADDDEEEIAMVLPLGEDRGVPTLLSACSDYRRVRRPAGRAGRSGR